MQLNIVGMASCTFIVILSDSDDEAPPVPLVPPIPVNPPTPPISPVPELAFPHPLDHLDSDMDVDSDPEDESEHGEDEIVGDSIGSVPQAGLAWEESLPRDTAYGSASSTRDDAESIIPTLATPVLTPIHPLVEDTVPAPVVPSTDETMIDPIPDTRSIIYSFTTRLSTTSSDTTSSYS